MEMHKIGNKYYSTEKLEEKSNRILEILKKEEQPYQVNKVILLRCIEKLDEDFNIKIFH